MKIKTIKRFTLCAAVCLLAGTLAFAACGSEDNGSAADETITAVYQSYVLAAEAKNETPLTYDEWLATVRGEDGKDGKDGKDGTGVSDVKLEEDGTLLVTLTDGRTITVGNVADVAGSAGNGMDGKDGANGLSAYEIAVKNGFTGSESEWLESLKGSDGADGVNGTDGINGTNGKDGANGLSAYEIAVKNGFAGSESEWLESLKGSDGTDGVNGTDGINGTNGKDGADGIGIVDVQVEQTEDDLFIFTFFLSDGTTIVRTATKPVKQIQSILGFENTMGAPNPLVATRYVSFPVTAAGENPPVMKINVLYTDGTVGQVQVTEEMLRCESEINYDMPGVYDSVTIEMATPDGTLDYTFGLAIYDPNDIYIFHAECNISVEEWYGGDSLPVEYTYVDGSKVIMERSQEDIDYLSNAPAGPGVAVIIIISGYYDKITPYAIRVNVL